METLIVETLIFESYEVALVEGLKIGMLSAVGAGFGGMLIHFCSRIFKIIGGA